MERKLFEIILKMARFVITCILLQISPRDQSQIWWMNRGS